MPAFNSGAIEMLVRSALVAEGLTKKTVVGGAFVDTGEPSPDALRLARAVINAISAHQALWQATQVVLTPGITPGASVGVGTLP